MSDQPFDLRDPVALRRWLINLRVTVDDAHEVVADMMRPLRRRRLGHVQHRILYRESYDSMTQLISHALQQVPPGSEPSGSPAAH